jgi:hypothetical protein
MVHYDLRRSCFFCKNLYLSKRYNIEQFSMWKSSQQHELSFKLSCWNCFMEPVMGRNIPKQCVHENSVCDFLSLGHCVPWMMRPLDDASLGRHVPWTMLPLDDASLNDVSRPFGTDWPYAEISCVGLYRHSWAYNYTNILCQDTTSISMRSRVWRYRSGTRHPRAHSPRDGTSKTFRSRTHRSGSHCPGTLEPDEQTEDFDLEKRRKSN